MNINEIADIGSEIDRILSSKINTDLLGSLNLSLLNSPSVRKKSKHQLLVSPALSSSKHSKLDQSIIEENIYEKADQILKLHSMLQSQVQNINELVRDNEALDKENQILKIELEKMKKINQELQQTKIKDREKYQQDLSVLKVQLKSLIEEKNIKKKKLLIANTFYVNFNQKGSNLISKAESFCQTQLQPTNLINIISRLKQQVQSLQKQNLKLSQKLTEFLTQRAPLNEKQKNTERQENNLEYYQSFFLQSQTNQIDETQKDYSKIRSILFGSNQNNFFQTLKSVKYEGQLIQGRKFGIGSQDYSNGLRYEGMFKKNQRDGFGRLSYKNILIYQGQWRKNYFNGKGSLFICLNQNFKKIDGNFILGHLQGYSTVEFKSGSKLRCKFKNNKILKESMLLSQKQNVDHRKKECGRIIFNQTQKLIFSSKNTENIQIQ